MFLNEIFLFYLFLFSAFGYGVSLNENSYYILMAMWSCSFEAGELNVDFFSEMEKKR